MALTLAELAAAKGFTVNELLPFGVRSVNGHVEIPYHLADGTEHPRVRIRDAIIAKYGSRWGPGDADLIPYGLEHPVPIEKFVFVVEGETDSWACWTGSLPAIGIPGATNARRLRSKDVAPAEKVYVVEEPDHAGTRFPHQVSLALYDSGFPGKVFSVKMPAPFKDPQAAFAAKRDEFRNIMRAAIQTAKPLERLQQTNSSAIKVLSYDDLALRSSEVVDWLVEGFVRRSGLVMLAGAPKTGKSTLARNLAGAVASGSEFLGRRCQKGRVLWIALEEPLSHLREQVDVMGLNRLPISYVCDQPVDETAFLRLVVEEHRPDLVIVDTIGRFAKIENINDYSQVARATQPMLDLRQQYGTTFALVHHANNMGGVLGSTMWRGVVDTIMTLTRNNDGVRFVQSLQRSGVDMEATALTMDQDYARISIADSKWIVDQRAAERHILAYLATVESASRESVANHSGRRIAVGRSALDSLVSAGLVRVIGAGTKGDPRMYFLSPAETPPKEKGSRPLDSSESRSRKFLDSSELVYKVEESGESRNPVEAGRPWSRQVEETTVIPGNPPIPPIPEESRGNVVSIEEARGRSVSPQAEAESSEHAFDDLFGSGGS